MATYGVIAKSFARMLSVESMPMPAKNAVMFPGTDWASSDIAMAYSGKKLNKKSNVVLIEKNPARWRQLKTVIGQKLPNNRIHLGPLEKLLLENSTNYLGLDICGEITVPIAQWYIYATRDKLDDGGIIDLTVCGYSRGHNLMKTLEDMSEADREFCTPPKYFTNSIRLEGGMTWEKLDWKTKVRFILLYHVLSVGCQFRFVSGIIYSGKENGNGDNRGKRQMIKVIFKKTGPANPSEKSLQICSNLGII